MRSFLLETNWQRCYNIRKSSNKVNPQAICNPGIHFVVIFYVGKRAPRIKWWRYHRLVTKRWCELLLFQISDVSVTEASVCAQIVIVDAINCLHYGKNNYSPCHERESWNWIELHLYHVIMTLRQWQVNKPKYIKKAWHFAESQYGLAD